jgi:exodeoxyribonuclease VII large subunit
LDELEQSLLAVVRARLAQQTDRTAWLAHRLAQVHPGAELRQRARRLDDLESRLARGMRHWLLRQRADLAHVAAELRHASPLLQLARAKQRIEASDARYARAMRKRLDHLRSRIEVAGGRLNAVSPLATLQRGYAIVTDAANHVVTDAAQLAKGELIQARLAVGVVRARVESTGERNE